MASFTGITAAKATDVLNQSIVSGAINGAGHLILTRGNGSTIDAGDFTAIVTSILTAQVNTAVGSAVPTAVAGTVVTKTGVSGAMTFTEFNSNNLVNALIKAALTGNVTINVADLPSTPKANTQFIVKFQQDATGGRTLTLTGFKKSQGLLTLSTAPNAIDLVVFMYDGTNWYAGLMGLDFK